jgi:4'-phosphopantetheinyl transferase
MENEIRVEYCITESLDGQALRDAMQQLSDDERIRCDRLVREHDRRDFAFAHALLRQSLSSCGTLPPHAWTFTAGLHGKPSLTDDLAARERLTFNLAHTNGLVACCVARDADVGIDVEAIVPSVDIHGIAARFFSSPEAAQLERCAESLRPVRFTELWTLKEAYIKARGDGLLYALDRFTFDFEESSRLRFDDATDTSPSQWAFALFAPTNRHRMAVAVNSGIARFSSSSSIVPMRST